MSRQQFLAELNQYLSFVGPEQRNDIIAYFTEKLEQAGPEHEAEALAEIGTPMSVAITLKRRLEAQEPLIPEHDTRPSPKLVKFDQENEAEKVETPQSEVYTEPVESMESRKSEQEEEEVEPELAAKEEPDAVSGKSIPEVAEPDPSEPEESTSEEESPPEPYVQKPEPQMEKRSGFGRVLSAIGITILSIIIIALFAGIAAYGVLICESAVEIIISGINAMGYLVHALMILSGGAIILAAGLLVTWFAIWAAISLISAMVRKYNKTPAAENSKLKSLWVVVLIILAVLVSLGIICGAVSFFMGGDISIIHNDSAFARISARLAPANILGFLSSLVS